ncbi:hypothetical protein DFR70_11857 [Nocardia tenerifensis]|uniref:Uncharacterized protein n=1 Tax=Nocardia tenerifensis TaxID=228006 RepID=A0A318JVI4_9NOCA|nr:hypothetical protein [Nocardia tenerifensis]PXX57402.1 hypothetical protein DFR70_11857 [Nocardia tenerifensis]
MNDTVIRRTTGAAGLAATVLLLVELPLYFVYGGAPPDWNILTRSMFGLIGNTLLMVFMLGLPHLLKSRDPEYAWIGSIVAAAGLIWLTVSAVSTCLEVGAAIAAPEPIDPTIAVPATYLLYGSLTKLLLTLFLTAFGIAIASTALLPRWTMWSAFVLAAIHVAFVPSMYFGNDPANFYAANGWGTTATTGGMTILWLLAVSVALLRTSASDTAPARVLESSPSR